MEITKETNIFQDLFTFLKKWLFSISMLFIVGVGFVLLIYSVVLDLSLYSIFIAIYGWGIIFLAIFTLAFEHLCYLFRKSSGFAPDENIKNTKMEGKCENEKND